MLPKKKKIWGKETDSVKPIKGTPPVKFRALGILPNKNGILQQVKRRKVGKRGWRYSQVVTYLASLFEGLGLISSNEKVSYMSKKALRKTPSKCSAWTLDHSLNKPTAKNRSRDFVDSQWRPYLLWGVGGRWDGWRWESHEKGRGGTGASIKIKNIPNKKK